MVFASLGRVVAVSIGSVVASLLSPESAPMELPPHVLLPPPLRWWSPSRLLHYLHPSLLGSLPSPHFTLFSKGFIWTVSTGFLGIFSIAFLAFFYPSRTPRTCHVWCDQLLRSSMNPYLCVHPFFHEHHLLSFQLQSSYLLLLPPSCSRSIRSSSGSPGKLYLQRLIWSSSSSMKHRFPLAWTWICHAQRPWLITFCQPKFGLWVLCWIVAASSRVPCPRRCGQSITVWSLDFRNFRGVHDEDRSDLPGCCQLRLPPLVALVSQSEHLLSLKMCSGSSVSSTLSSSSSASSSSSFSGSRVVYVLRGHPHLFGLDNHAAAIAVWEASHRRTGFALGQSPMCVGFGPAIPHRMVFRSPPALLTPGCPRRSHRRSCATHKLARQPEKSVESLLWSFCSRLDNRSFFLSVGSRGWRCWSLPTFPSFQLSRWGSHLFRRPVTQWSQV